MEKYKEVKHRIQTNSNTAAADKSAVSVSVTGQAQCSGVVFKTHCMNAGKDRLD